MILQAFEKWKKGPWLFRGFGLDLPDFRKMSAKLGAGIFLLGELKGENLTHFFQDPGFLGMKCYPVI